VCSHACAVLVGSLVLVSGKPQRSTRGSWEEELHEYLVWGDVKRRRPRRAKPGADGCSLPHPPGGTWTSTACCGPHAVPLSGDLHLLTAFLKGRVLSILRCASLWFIDFFKDHFMILFSVPFPKGRVLSILKVCRGPQGA